MSFNVIEGDVTIRNGADAVDVKTASTAAVAGDKALVVAVSPNNTPVLPAGAATAANQATEISGLSAIFTRQGDGSQVVTGPLTDTELRATPVPVSVAGVATEATLSTRLAEATFTGRVGEVQATPTANTVLGRLKDLFDAVVARLGTLGQKAMSASTPVVIANDQSSVPIAFTSGAVDAFQRLRISTSVTLFDGKTLYDEQSVHYAEGFVAGGSAAMVANQPIRRLTVTGASGASAVRQARRYKAYQAGKSQQAFLTFQFGVAVANVRRRAGYFDDRDGIFFEQTAAGISIVKRTSTSGSPVDTVVAQGDWNIDKLDGTGDSGITLDISKSTFLAIDFAWLGIGQIRVGFEIGETVVYAHAFNWSNLSSGVYMATPALPVRYEITNTAASAGASLDCICASVTSEAGSPYPGVLTAIDRGVSTQAFVPGDGTTMKPLVSVRTKSAFTRMTAVPVSVSVVGTTTSNTFRWALLLNPTITGGPAASWTGIDKSGLEFDIARTGAVSGGYQVACGFGASDAEATLQANGILGLGAEVDGTRDVYVLAVQQFTGANENFTGAVSFREHT